MRFHGTKIRAHARIAALVGIALSLFTHVGSAVAGGNSPCGKNEQAADCILRLNREIQGLNQDRQTATCEYINSIILPPQQNAPIAQAQVSPAQQQQAAAVDPAELDELMRNRFCIDKNFVGKVFSDLRGNGCNRFADEDDADVAARKAYLSAGAFSAQEKEFHRMLARRPIGERVSDNLNVKYLQQSSEAQQKTQRAETERAAAVRAYEKDAPARRREALVAELEKIRLCEKKGFWGQCMKYADEPPHMAELRYSCSQNPHGKECKEYDDLFNAIPIEDRIKLNRKRQGMPAYVETPVTVGPPGAPGFISGTHKGLPIVENARCVPSEIRGGICRRFDHEDKDEGERRISCMAGRMSGKPTAHQKKACEGRKFYVKSLAADQREALPAEFSPEYESFRRADLGIVQPAPVFQGPVQQVPPPKYHVGSGAQRPLRAIPHEPVTQREVKTDPTCVEQEFGYCKKYDHEDDLEAFLRLKCVEAYLLEMKGDEGKNAAHACERLSFTLKGNSPAQEAGALREIFRAENESTKDLKIAKHDFYEARFRLFVKMLNEQELDAERTARELAEQQEARERQAEAALQAEKERARLAAEERARWESSKASRLALEAKLNSVRQCVAPRLPHGCDEYADETHEDIVARKSCNEFLQGTGKVDTCGEAERLLHANIQERIRKNEALLARQGVGPAQQQQPQQQGPVAQGPVEIRPVGPVLQDSKALQALRFQAEQAEREEARLRALVMERNRKNLELQKELGAILTRERDVDGEIQLALAEKENAKRREALAAQERARAAAAAREAELRVEEFNRAEKALQARIQSLKTEENRLDSTIESLKSELAQLKSKAGADRSRVAQLAAEIKALEDKVNDKVAAQLKEAEAQRALAAKAAAEQQETERLRALEAQRQQESDKARRELAAANEKEQRAKAEAAEVAKRLQATEALVAKSQGAVDALSGEVDKLKADLERLKKDPNMNAEALQELLKREAELDRQIAIARAAKSAENERAQQLAAERVAEEARVQAALKSLEKRVGAGEGSLAAHEAEAAQLRRDLIRLGSEKAEASKQLKEIAAAEAALDKKIKDALAAAAAKAEADAKAEAAKAAAAKAEAAKVDAARAEALKAEAESAKAQAEAQKAQAEVAKNQGQGKAEADLAKSQADVAKTQAELAKAEADLARAKADAAKAEAEARKKVEADAAEAEKNKLEAERGSAAARMKAALDALEAKLLSSTKPAVEAPPAVSAAPKAPEVQAPSFEPVPIFPVAPVVQAPAPVQQAPAPVQQAPAPVQQATAPVAQAPAPEAPAPVATAPAPKAPVAPAPAPAPALPVVATPKAPAPAPVAPAPAPAVIPAPPAIPLPSQQLGTAPQATAKAPVVAVRNSANRACASSFGGDCLKFADEDNTEKTLRWNCLREGDAKNACVDYANYVYAKRGETAPATLAAPSSYSSAPSSVPTVRAPSGVSAGELQRKAGSNFPRIIGSQLCLEGHGDTCTKFFTGPQQVSYVVDPVAKPTVVAEAAPAPKPASAPAPSPAAVKPPVPNEVAKAPPPLPVAGPQTTPAPLLTAAQGGSLRSPLHVGAVPADVRRLLVTYNQKLAKERRMTDAELDKITQLIVDIEASGHRTAEQIFAKLWVESRFDKAAISICSKDMAAGGSCTHGEKISYGLMQIHYRPDRFPGQHAGLMRLVEKYKLELPYGRDVDFRVNLQDPVFSLQLAMALDRDNRAMYSGPDGQSYIHPAVLDAVYYAGPLPQTGPYLRDQRDEKVVWQTLRDGLRQYDSKGGFVHVNNITGLVVGHDYAKWTSFVSDWMAHQLKHPDQPKMLRDFVTDWDVVQRHIGTRNLNM